MSINLTLDNNFIMDETMLSILNEISDIESKLNFDKVNGNGYSAQLLTHELNQKQIELMIYLSNKNVDRLNEKNEN